MQILFLLRVVVVADIVVRVLPFEEFVVACNLSDCCDWADEENAVSTSLSSLDVVGKASVSAVWMSAAMCA